MKVLRLFMLIGSLCAASGAGCMANTSPGDDQARESTSQVEQKVGDDLCTQWAACYAFCRNHFHCNDPVSCNQQVTCLNNCDSTYAPAPEICPYP